MVPFPPEFPGANPSLRDLETQTMYQGLFRNALPGSDIEPFVGVIVNPYLAITESSSHVECFYVALIPTPVKNVYPTDCRSVENPSIRADFRKSSKNAGNTFRNPKFP